MLLKNPYTRLEASWPKPLLKNPQGKPQSSFPGWSQSLPTTQTSSRRVPGVRALRSTRPAARRAGAGPPGLPAWPGSGQSIIPGLQAADRRPAKPGCRTQRDRPANGSVLRQRVAGSSRTFACLGTTLQITAAGRSPRCVLGNGRRDNSSARWHCMDIQLQEAGSKPPDC